MNRRPFLSAVLAAIILVFPATIMTSSVAAATLGQRCADMTTAVNARREPADLRTLTVLCRVAAVRARDMVVGGYFTHDLAPAKRALKAAGIRWCKISEVIAWHSAWQTPSRWARDWWSSPEHRSMLNDGQFDAGAGSFTGTRTYYPYAVAVYYIVDRC